MRCRLKYKTYIILLFALCGLLYVHNRTGSGNSERYLIPSGDTLVFSVRIHDGDYFLHHSEPAGYQLDLIRSFAKSQHCAYRIMIEPHLEKRWTGLIKGAVDVVVCSSEADSIRAKYSQQIVTSRTMDENTHTAWATSVKNTGLTNAINRWLAQYRDTKEYQQQQKYFESHMQLPVRVAHGSLSPYDTVMKRHAGRIGWDWRLLAALVCQESRFQNDVISKRGAEGLMQVIPQTAELYGVVDLQDPKENLRAGVSHLQSLQQYFSKDSMDKVNRIKFVLASYNAGLGRIIDCQKFAESLNKDARIWEEVASAIPLMKHAVYYNSKDIELGPFNGSETLRFVENIMERYQHYQNLVAE